MRRFSVFAALLAALVPLSCGGDGGGGGGDTTGPSQPQPTGSYVGTWTLSMVVQGVTYRLVCDGSVQISSVSGGSVSGNFTLGLYRSGSAPPGTFTCPAVAVTGTLSGSLSGTSLSNVALDTPLPGADLWDDAIPDECQISQPRTFSGTLSGNQLTLTGSVTVTCPDAPVVDATFDFSGTKSS